MKEDDDQFGFQKSLDGNDEDWVTGRVYKGDKPWLSKYQGKDFSKKKTKIDIDSKIDVISFFTAVVIVMSLLFFVSAHAVEDNQPIIVTNSESGFVYSLDSCITHLYKTLPIQKQIPKELIVAQAIIETGWGGSRFANEGNNLFGIRTWNKDEKYLPSSIELGWTGWGIKVFETKCDSVADYIRIINEVPVYAEFREMRQDGVSDALVLARTLNRWAEEPYYTDLIKNVIQYNIRGVYEL